MEREIIEFARHIATSNPIIAYIFFFINAALQILFPPYPGDTIIALEGYISSLGFLNSNLLLLTTVTGTYLSSVLLYFLSFKFGNSLIAHKFTEKFFDTENITKLEKWFNKYGAMAIIINKFIPGMGSITLIAAGAFQLSKIPALIAIAIASVIHNTILFVSGKLTGDNISKIKIMFVEYNNYLWVGLVTVFILYIYIKRLSQNKG
ncbi:hypothetical protein Q428_04470 [Fervidicella metallireducens AeB]|uniref:VTT domain-containing protein n=1 Tax=Fervidicella metallireducens AeB TaxID=1403537 RepID=A0A017RYV3_9CLOT|nr:VTT domain-containing protein [Fervidicella metallireducens]EYE89095.1 hypothetical protein Q428_04470 [Fervidicella metallireducens AeB]